MLAVIDTVLLQREIIEVHLASLYSLLSMGYWDRVGLCNGHDLVTSTHKVVGHYDVRNEWYFSDNTVWSKLCECNGHKSRAGSVVTNSCRAMANIFLSQCTPLERCSVHNMAVARPKFRGPRSASIARSQKWLGLPAGRFHSLFHSSRVVAFLQAVVRPKFREPRSASIAWSQVWLGLPAGRFQSGGTCRIHAARAWWWSSRGKLREIWPKSRRRLLVTRWESGEQPVVLLTSAFDTWRVYGILKILRSAHVSNSSRRESPRNCVMAAL